MWSFCETVFPNVESFRGYDKFSPEAVYSPYEFYLTGWLEIGVRREEGLGRLVNGGKPLRQANSSDSIKIQETPRKYPSGNLICSGSIHNEREREEKERGNRDGEHVGFRVKGDRRERKEDKTK